ncbi:MAG: hypothetical protein IT381_30790 [Deltaproteobacteria bacterium]|nr:hypothetical protein [Deltaproteobacteria bacterium]
MILGLGGFDHNGAVCAAAGGAITAFLEAERPARAKNLGLSSPEIIDATLAALGPLPPPAHIALADARFTERASSWLMPYLDRRFPGVPRTIHHHHDCHLACAFAASPFDRATAVSLDAAGDGLAAATGVATRALPAKRTLQVASRHSLGRLWWAVSEYCGMPSHHAAGKTMALAAYGEPRFLDALAAACPLLADGRYEWSGPPEDPERFREMTGALAWIEALTGAPRARGEPAQIHKDVAATMQAWTVRVVSHVVRAAVAATGIRDVCIAGGVALNGLANEALLRDGVVDRLFVPSCPDDRGLAIGAACLAAAARGEPIVAVRDGLDPFLGAPASGEIPAGFTVVSADLDVIAARLVAGDLLAICDGRDEAGPRALGRRSLLASPASSSLRARLNDITGREQFRPFGCSLPAEHAAKWLGMRGDSPYMLRIVEVPPAVRDRIPAVVHVDGTTRPQTVSRDRQPFLHALLCRLEAHGHPPLLLNTSLNGRSEPLAHSRADAFAIASKLGLDGVISDGALYRSSP